MTHYETFGLPPGSMQNLLHARFQELSKSLHPDAGGTDEAFAEMNAAWQVLKDPVKRREYDKRLAADGRNCPKCKGRGLITKSRTFTQQYQVPCTNCKSTGRI